jgi:hypothetical protein
LCLFWCLCFVSRVQIAEEKEKKEEEEEEFHCFVLRSFQGVPVVSSGYLYALLVCFAEEENELSSLAGDLEHGRRVSSRWGESSMGTTSGAPTAAGHDTTTVLRCANAIFAAPQ